MKRQSKLTAKRTVLSADRYMRAGQEYHGEVVLERRVVTGVP